MIASFLSTLVRVFRRWPMDVISGVDLNKPSLFVFDPRDEIISFPASLFIGLTNKHFSQDIATRKIEEEIRSCYPSFIQIILQNMRENGFDMSSITSCSEKKENESVVYQVWFELTIHNRFFILFFRWRFLEFP